MSGGTGDDRPRRRDRRGPVCRATAATTSSSAKDGFDGSWAARATTGSRGGAGNDLLDGGRATTSSLAESARIGFLFRKGLLASTRSATCRKSTPSAGSRSPRRERRADLCPLIPIRDGLAARIRRGRRADGIEARRGRHARASDFLLGDLSERASGRTLAPPRRPLHGRAPPSGPRRAPGQRHPPRFTLQPAGRSAGASSGAPRPCRGRYHLLRLIEQILEAAPPRVADRASPRNPCAAWRSGGRTGTWGVISPASSSPSPAQQGTPCRSSSRLRALPRLFAVEALEALPGLEVDVARLPHQPRRVA